MHQSNQVYSPAPDPTSGMLAAFVDVLLPGNERWPSASAVGVQHAVLKRLQDKNGDEGVSSLSKVLGEYAAPFTGMTADAAINAVAAFEKDQPGHFTWLRNAAIYAYYESADVVAAINALGICFRLNPHKDGYRLPPFDPATQTPTHGRGVWIPTDDVRRVDVTTLDLDSEATQNWGLQR